jgi:signal transduction histidine kinase
VVISAVLAVDVVRSQTLPGHTEPYDFFVVTLQFAVAGTLGILSRTRRSYMQAVETRAEHAEAERDRQVALAAAEERTMIARELHDVVAHHVSLMAVQSEAAAALLPARPAEAGKAVEIIGQTAREALTELRRLLGVLRGPADAGGRAAARSPTQPRTAGAPKMRSTWCCRPYPATASPPSRQRSAGTPAASHEPGRS